ncbi:MAG: cytidine deaminase [Bacteroidetes bacterium]|nr:cytidine deaminase [Bacteroidota bacterium]
MKIRNINIQIEEYDHTDSLKKAEAQLLGLAQEAIKGSYAPYSEFHVGAAVLLENGEIVKGSNQENAAYPSGLCAERVAIFHAKSKYPSLKVKSIAITAASENFITRSPITPCGACRQVIAETENRQNEKIRIIMKGQEGIVQAVNGIENLLPLVFKEEQLKKSKRK